MRYLINFRFYRGLFILCALIYVTPTWGKSFEVYLEGVKKEAREKGISDQTLKEAFKKVKKPDNKVVRRDRSQVEFIVTFDKYYNRRGRPLVGKGKRYSKKFTTLLDSIEARWQVPREYILALWGVESRFGHNMGKFSVIQSLATLAYEGRREKFFREELMHALHILEEGHVRPESFKGGWAGALGQCQFMPSSFRNFAYDEDGDGRKDIWHSVPDVLSSIGHYLAKHGWKKGEPWGEEVILTLNISDKFLDLKVTQPVQKWVKLGVAPRHGKTFSHPQRHASLIKMPSGKKQKDRFFLVYDNFKNILKWNRSYVFALTVGHLAEKIRENK